VVGSLSSEGLNGWMLHEVHSTPRQTAQDFFGGKNYKLSYTARKSTNSIKVAHEMQTKNFCNNSYNTQNLWPCHGPGG
jgi:hypothetical protein